LQRRIDRFGPRRDAARSAPLESPPQPLDANLLADGEALEAAWQVEIRAMIAARRGGAQVVAAARAARAESEAIVARIEAARALTLDGHKVKARAESWRRDGAPLKSTAAEDQPDDGVWTDMADLPRYEAPAARMATAAFA
jgi:hypothetical protein